MAMVDSLTEFCDNVSLKNASSTGGLFHGDVVDMGVKQYLGVRSKPVWLNILITTSFVITTANATVSFYLGHASSQTATGGNQLTGTVKVLTRFPPLGDDVLLQNYSMSIPLVGAARPNTLQEAERYWQIEVIKTATTAGAFSAYLSFEPEGWQIFPEGDR